MQAIFEDDSTKSMQETFEDNNLIKEAHGEIIAPNGFFINGITDSEPLAPRTIEVEYDGFPDDEALAIVKAKAQRTIKENAAKLRKTKVKKVAIVGTAMTHKDAPYDDPSWELWGLNDHWNNMPRATRWFEVNNTSCRVADIRGDASLGKRIDWLRKAPIPVYMEEHYDDVPMSVRYPFEEINAWISELDPCGVNYFTNSVSYMIALAIYEGFDVIHLYGVDMAVGSEYEKQRPSCEFWVGVAKGLGIKFFIPDQSDLLKCLVPYGRETAKLDAFTLKMNDRRTFQREQVAKIDGEIAKRQNEIQSMTATKFQYQGSLADIDQTLKVWRQI